MVFPKCKHLNLTLVRCRINVADITVDVTLADIQYGAILRSLLDLFFRNAMMPIYTYFSVFTLQQVKTHKVVYWLFSFHKNHS